MVRSVKDWLRELQGLVQSLFSGPGGGSPDLWHLAALAGELLAGALALVTLFFAVRTARRIWRGGRRDLGLLKSSQGRKVLLRAREIRAGRRRLDRAISRGGGDRGEARALRSLLGRFVEKDLPETTERALSFAAAGGEHLAAVLTTTLARQRRQWNDAPDAQARENLNKQIAATRHRLAQVENANANLARLLEGLDDAASALRLLEIEMASLEEVRSPALEDVREQLADMAEGLRYQREAHRSLDDA